MIVHPDHLELALEVYVNRQSYAAATVMDWTRAAVHRPQVSGL